MRRLYIIRHGKAAATFAESLDPGLSDVGKDQAEKIVGRLGDLTPITLVTSPLMRARETSMPLSRHWKRGVIVDDAISEIPTPAPYTLENRAEWLREFKDTSWRKAIPQLAEWRERLLNALITYEKDTIFFSHFIAINVAVGAATGDERIVCFQPDNCSVTILETDGSTLRLVERGHEAETVVL